MAAVCTTRYCYGNDLFTLSYCSYLVLHFLTVTIYCSTFLLPLSIALHSGCRYLLLNFLDGAIYCHTVLLPLSIALLFYCRYCPNFLLPLSIAVHSVCHYLLLHFPAAAIYCPIHPHTRTVHVLTDVRALGKSNVETIIYTEKINSYGNSTSSRT